MEGSAVPLRVLTEPGVQSCPSKSPSSSQQDAVGQEDLGWFALLLREWQLAEVLAESRGLWCSGGLWS